MTMMASAKTPMATSGFLMTDGAAAATRRTWPMKAIRMAQQIVR